MDCDCRLCLRDKPRSWRDEFAVYDEYLRLKDEQNKELDNLVQELYRDNRNGGKKLWEIPYMPATWNAELATKKLGSWDSTTTPQRKVYSPTAGGATPGRFTPMMKSGEPPKQPNTLMMAGDWHGQLYWAFQAIHYAALQGADTILHVGDFGWWRACPATWQFLEEVNKELDKFGIDLYWVDGNHEDHSFWNTFNVPNAVPQTFTSYPRITHLPRGYRWEWWGDIWMAVGGAYSVDRTFGTEGKTWWEGETLSTEQIDYCKRPGRVDIIVSHDCPGNVDIPGIDPKKPGWLKIGGVSRRVPEVELMRAAEHRQKLWEIVNTVKPTELYHGHYHRAYNTLARLTGGGYMNVTGLDRDGTTMAKNTLIIDGGLDRGDDLHEIA